jgi:hypothetical protein
VGSIEKKGEIIQKHELFARLQKSSPAAALCLKFGLQQEVLTL